MKITIDNIATHNVILNRQLTESRISPLFFALNSSVHRPSQDDNTAWLSVTANHISQSFTTYLGFLVDYSLPPSCDAILAADFYKQCGAHFPAFTHALYENHDNDLDYMMSGPSVTNPTVPPAAVCWDTTPREYTPSSVPRGGPGTVSSPSSLSLGRHGAVTSSEVLPVQCHKASALTMKYDDDLTARNGFRGTAATLTTVLSDEHEDFPVALTVVEKKAIIKHLIEKCRVTVCFLRRMALRHENMEIRVPGEKRKSVAVLRMEFRAHECTPACLVLKSEAALAGIPSATPMTELELRESKLIFDGQSTKHPRKRRGRSAPQSGNKRRKIQASVGTPEPMSTEFPVILSQSEKDQIVREFRASTNNRAMKRYECSFCGKLELADAVKIRPTESLDISLLQKAVAELRKVTCQARIESYKPSSLVNGSYVLCHLCDLSVSKNTFKSLPVRSYANGTWIGDIPDELNGLTFLEEQCIARARATKCMYKLSLTSAGQFAARGNVCVLPQDTSSFLTAMPPPLSMIRDEICVILVGSPDVEITYEKLKKSPLLVRRRKIERALLWLIEHNPLYSDLDRNIMLENLEEYPEYDCPLAIRDFLRTNSASNQGTSYTSYSDQANAELFEEGSNNTVELTATTLVDVDSINVTYRQRKLDALRKLKKSQAEFVKFPSGNMPLSTSRNPRVFGWLWPTLFPYGVGMVDNNDVRISTGFGFRNIDTLPHIEHLLTLSDRRFQVHKAFKFVMNNIVQRRQSSFKSRLAVNRSWFPVVQKLWDKVDEDAMNSYQAKLDKGESAFPKPETEGEKAAVQLMKCLSYVSDHIPGSVGDVNTMKQQIRSKIMCHGLPHVFATVNPADSHNPIAQVLAGRDIDLDKIFHALDEVKNEGSTRAKVVADNPVAGAEFFHLMVTKFFDIILGAKRVSKIGILGKTQGWYAVVEAQVRGSLHLHVLIWIEGVPASPIDMKERMNSDEIFKEQLAAWYDDMICQSLPHDTVPYTVPEGGAKQQPVMSRPLDPDMPDYEQRRDQHHRDISENCGLIHSHNATCFKHIPRRIHSLIDPDEDCRFRLPREEVLITHFDDDGDLLIRCETGSLNGHNPTATLCLGCNTDLKQTASGSSAMAMVEYMCNYTAKLQLDTSVVFSALCASIKALQENPPVDENGDLDRVERTRKGMIKATNTLVGKRELTGQQTASLLLGRKNRYTSDEYCEYWWSSMLRDLARSVFVENLNSDAHAMATDDHEQDSEHPSPDNGDPAEQRMIIPEDEDDSLIVLSAESLNQTNVDDDEVQQKQYSKLFCDMFYRPSELENMCLWDIMCHYQKDKKPRSKNQRKTYLSFQPGHPQYTSHCLRKLDNPVIPVLMGYRVPRNDFENDSQKYAVSMLALFKPWSKEKESPLKTVENSWCEAFDQLRPLMAAEHVRVTQNMQLLYQTRDAKFDYAAERSRRLSELKRMAQDSGINVDDEGTDEYDPLWENAMQAEVDPDDLAEAIGRDSRAIRDAVDINRQAGEAGFYSVVSLGNQALCTGFDSCSRIGDNDDRFQAALETKRLEQEKSALLKSRLKAAEDRRSQHTDHILQPSEGIPKALSTTLENEGRKAQVLYEQLHSTASSGNNTPLNWHSLHPYQQLCFVLIIKHTLNNEQARAFLLLADKIGRDLENKRKSPPMTLLCTGPGGTGKSVIFQAWREFYGITGHPERLRLTAPTGVVASDIGGCTIHSEVSLRISPSKLKSTPSLRTRLEERISPLETLILDEAYFLGAKDVGRISEYLGMATGKTEDIFGGLNFATCGDPCQLPPPRGKTLFDRQLVNCHKNNNLNDLNENVREDVKGIQIWQQVEHVVVLEEIMRQKGDPLLIDILKRLRKGVCTPEDKKVLDRHVLTSAECTEDISALTNIRRWIHDPEHACPLIVYTNIARDRHNDDMAKAFAAATDQSCHFYHARDTRGRGRKKRHLTGLAAEAAWSVPVKEANDLGGRVPFVAGMPVFCTENIATELGISNGSPGRLVSIIYEEFDGQRYAISANVDFEAYTNSDPGAVHPHRVTLQPVNHQIQYFLPGSDKPYHATRSQLPLIPAFAFTSHNAQGRSLDVCCIDLAGCTSIQSAYVMLSRVRSLEGLCILRPFDLDRIRSHISEELRTELRRAEEKAEQTKEYSRERLAWFYDLVPEGQVDLLTNGGLELEYLDLDTVMTTPV